MVVKFLAMSYRRAGSVTTQDIYPEVKYVVSESDKEEYLKAGHDIVVVPDSAQGNLCRVRNYSLDHLMGEADCLVLMDDDYRGVYVWQEQERRRLDMEELREFCEVNAILCRDWGFYFWGLNLSTDKGFYREHTPFGTVQYIGGPFQAHMKGSEIRYDEELPLKEDYDLSLQHMRRYGGCLRVNYACYDVKQAEQEGGCAVYRNSAAERDQFMKLRRKWGSDIVKKDTSSRRGFDFNPIIKAPIKGV